MDKQEDYCVEGDKFNNGNGSVMRLAPVPIAYMNNEKDAMKYSGLQSRTTHNG
jgi:ADP-ribosyl-[dinitrogen reductase] hydrolase